jgi:hypothetical protein
MPETSVIFAVVWPVVAMLGVAVVVARLLRRWRWSPLVGGIVAGVLLGPFVLGHLSPDLFRRLFVGGSSELRALREAEAAYVQDIDTLKATGVTEAAITERQQAWNTQREKLRDELTGAEAAAQRPLRLAMLLVVAPLALFAAGNRLDMPRKPDLRPEWTSLLSLILIALVAPLGWWAMGLACVLCGMIAPPADGLCHFAARVLMPLLIAYALISFL